MRFGAKFYIHIKYKATYLREEFNNDIPEGVHNESFQESETISGVFVILNVFEGFTI
jgi:hypothetical protein